uniref:Glutathione S-transferase omega n=1 Tax=Plectus sambesii TaxID=2011161 RepID=A0A914XQ32_9BILA
MANFHGLNSITLNPDDELPPLASGKIRLYNMRFCPYAERAVLYFAKKNVSVEVINVNLVDKPKWYLERNPLGKVPTIEHDGKIIYESAVVAEYLDDIFPDSSVLPKDPYLRAHQKILVERLSAISGAFYGLLRATADNQEAGIANLKKALDTAESLLTDNFYGGKSSGYADMLVWPHLERVEVLPLIRPDLHLDKLLGTDYPKLTAYIARMKELPEVKVAIRPAEHHVQFFDSYKTGKPDYNIGITAA